MRDRQDWYACDILENGFSNDTKNWYLKAPPTRWQRIKNSGLEIRRRLRDVWAVLWHGASFDDY